MIAAWILYCALWALWLSAVAWGTERLLLSTRGPVRIVWLSAMVLSVIGPIIGYAVSRRERIVPAAAATSATVSSISATSQIMVRRYAVARRVDVAASGRTAATRIDRPLAVAWLVSVVGFLLYVVGGVVRLRIVRRRWHPDVVAGTAVMISDDTGPALVGVIDTTIVIPAWALALDPDALALMLRHELEHRAAGDTRTLAIAQALLVFMPWNPLVWWQLRRLRLAIEIDCDARVLRATSDVVAYGNLLLEFGRAPRGLGVVGAALADRHASQLEARIRRMIRNAPPRRGRVIALSIAATAIAIVIGCQLPTPPAPHPDAVPAGRSARSLRGDSSSARPDSASGRDVRDTSMSRAIEIERPRRVAAIQRELVWRDSIREIGRARTWRDSLPLELFEAQVGLAEARDSATRKGREARLDTARWVFDSCAPGPASAFPCRTWRA